MQQNFHVYDDNKGIIYLADGREVKFDQTRFSSGHQARIEAEKWAKRVKLIGQDDDVVMFMN